MKHATFGILLLLSPAVVLADSSLRSQILAMSGPINAAIMRKNGAAFAKAARGSVTADFRYSEPGGKPMGFDGMVEGMKQGFAAYQKVAKAGTTLVSVREEGNAGSAVSKHTMEATMVGADKKSHTMVFVGTSVDTYRKVGGKWLLATMTLKTDKMTMDGKPMPMGASRG